MVVCRAPESDEVSSRPRTVNESAHTLAMSGVNARMGDQRDKRLLEIAGVIIRRFIQVTLSLATEENVRVHLP